MCIQNSTCFFQARVRLVATPLLAKEHTPEDVSLAVREVASYFPALSQCESDVIKFLSKKIKAFLKQQRHLKKKAAEKEAENSTHVANDKSAPQQSQLSPIQSKEDRNPQPATVTDKESGQSDADSPPIDKSRDTKCSSSDNEPDAVSESVLSKRKRPVTKDPYDFDENIPVLSTTNRSSAKSKKAKMSNATPKHSEILDATEMAGKEFSSQNSLNVKFEVGHFVVLGEDTDEYHFCRVDDIVYHKPSAKYYMNITYYQLIDGRLEVYPARDKPDKPWTDKKVPLNTIILNLRHFRLVDRDMQNEILKITKEYYS